MGRLDRLELFNFKSYGGEVVVGPFKGFNAVIGTNGSGKSNLMDAISFVLGVKTSQLRGAKLRDLVFRNLKDPEDDSSKRKAHVKLYYVTDEGKMLSFMRRITLSGSCEMLVDDVPVSLATYNQRLADIGVLVKSRNFLVFQNEVEGIASKSPKDLMLMFEEVSGSAMLRREYEAALAEKDAAEEEVSFFWRKRKGLASEKKQYKEQKEEAERFLELKQRAGAIKTQRVLLQLFHLDKDLRAVGSEIAADTDESKELQALLEQKESGLTGLKDSIAALEQRRSSKQKQMRRLKAELEKSQPQRVKLETEVSGATRRLKGDEINLAKAQDASERLSQKISSLEADLQRVKTAVTDKEQEIAAAEEASVSAESMAEYRDLKKQSAMQTSAIQQELTTAGRNLDIASRQLEVVRAEADAVFSRREACEREAETYSRRVDDLAQLRAEAQRAVEDAERGLQQSQEMRGERDQIRAQLERTVNETTQSLRDARADVSENSQKRRFNDAVEALGWLFPGVRGRVSDLCKPSHDRYREAVAVIFGKLMDAIVVDTEVTGTECINYLKEQRVGMATFIPLRDVRPRPINESLRGLGGTAKLAIDVLDFEDDVAPAVLYAAGEAVVCDSLDEARHIRYDRGQKVKVCSLDGTLINKAGFMTGGGSRGPDRAGKWDRAEIETLKRRRTRAQEELAALGPPDMDRRATAERAERLDNERRRASILSQDHAEATRSRDEAAAKISALTAQVAEIQPQLDTAQEAAAAAQERVQELTQRLASLEQTLFGDFTNRNNVASVAEFEEQFIKRSEALREEKLELETRASRLTSQLKYEQSKSGDSEEARYRRRIDDQKAKLAQAERGLQELRSKQSDLQARHDRMREEVKAISAEHDAKSDEFSENRQEFSKESDALESLKKRMAQSAAKQEQLRSQRRRALVEAKVARIHVPTVGGDDNGDNEDDGAERMDVDDGEGAGETAGESATQDDDSALVDENVVVNFDALDDDYRQPQGDTDLETALGQLSDDLRTCEGQLEKLAPNMRAGEHMDDVAVRLAGMEADAEKARERARKAVDSFNTVRDERQKRFSTCFSQVADRISEVYKQLTKSISYPMGGTAYLSVEQQDEPYLAGVKFNAMPPTKRFRDMDQLSGGERTVAALALLFAIHEFKPSPFFILDEVDAALDTGNVSKVSTYIKSRAPELQTIVITLKDALFEKADALLGIFRDTSINASRLLTLDMTQYDQDPQAEPDDGPVTAVSGQPSEVAS